MRFIGETLECQMIQVYRQIEKNKVLFSIQFQMVRRENIDILLKEPMLDRKRRERVEE